MQIYFEKGQSRDRPGNHEYTCKSKLQGIKGSAHLFTLWRLSFFTFAFEIKEIYLRFFSFSNIAITSGCVGVNLIPRFNIPITFLAFCSISLAVCSLVNIK